MLKNIKSHTLKDKIHLGLLLVVLATLPFSSALNAISLGVYLGFLLILHRKKVSVDLSTILAILAISCFFLLAILDLREINDKYLKFVLRISPLALVPIVVYFSKCFTANIKNVTILLTISSLLAILFGVYNSLEFYSRPEEHFTLIHLPHTIRGKYHSVYFALQLGVNSILAYVCYKREKSLYYLLITILFVLFIILLGKRMAVLSLLLIGCIYLITNLKIKHIIKFVVTVITILAIFLIVPYNRWRMDQIDSPGEGSERLIMLETSIDVIKDNFLLGVGALNVSTELEKRFAMQGLVTPFFANNPHNQLLYIFLAFGLIGFVAYSGLQILWVSYSIKHKKTVFLYIYLFFFLSAITETILIRQQGIVLYSLVLSLLFFNESTYESK